VKFSGVKKSHVGFDPGKDKPESVISAVTNRSRVETTFRYFFFECPGQVSRSAFFLVPESAFVDVVNMGLAIEHSVNRHIKIRIWLINLIRSFFSEIARYKTRVGWFVLRNHEL